MDVDASRDPKTTKPSPALMLPDNLVNLIISRKACSDLVTRHDWTWDQAAERTTPVNVSMRVIDLKTLSQQM